jgi:hypothetical protein
MPWFFKHCTKAVRLLVEDADGDAELVLELLPHAASARVAVIPASAGISRRARRGVLLGELMWGPFVVVLVSRRWRSCGC